MKKSWELTLRFRWITKSKGKKSDDSCGEHGNILFFLREVSAFGHWCLGVLGLGIGVRQEIRTRRWFCNGTMKSQLTQSFVSTVLFENLLQCRMIHIFLGDRCLRENEGTNCLLCLSSTVHLAFLCSLNFARGNGGLAAGSGSNMMPCCIHPVPRTSDFMAIAYGRTLEAK